MMLNKSNVSFTENNLGNYLKEIVALVTTYQIIVITSDKIDSGTNANVYIIIFGQRNHTGSINLSNKMKFKKKIYVQ